MSESYNVTDQSATYFCTFQVVCWIDIFTRKIYKDIIVDSLNYCVRYKSLSIHAWCLMSNHLHLILSSEYGSLSDCIRDFKRFTSVRIIKTIFETPESRGWMLSMFATAAKQHSRNTKYQLWTHENHAVLLNPFKSGMVNSKMNYVHNNPVEAGIVNEPKHYLYSSARDYEGIKGLVEVSLL